MSKLKKLYACEKCGHRQGKWSGQCELCHEWNTLKEGAPASSGLSMASVHPLMPEIISIRPFGENRLVTGILEFDRVVGGGMMTDGITLLSGDPGIGKSTLTLQIAAKIAEQGKRVFYFSGEESADQITHRLHRLQLPPENVYIFNTASLEEVISTVQEHQPQFVILDSVQVFAAQDMEAGAGSVGQVRAIAERMMHIAKKKNIPVLLIGHVTKEGNLAGPMVLSHLVDTVLYLEGEQYQHLRLLRSLKNRFGSTLEVGVFAMEEEGLKEVKNPSSFFLEGRSNQAVGSAVTVTLEGTRPFLLEIQALTTSTVFGYPKRTASGIDVNRVQLMIAVLNKYTEVKLDSQDVYINIAGGFKVKDPATDLAICMAILSSKKKMPLPPQSVMLGEVGLSGEIRSATQLEKRLHEVSKIGFKQAFVPQTKIKKPPDLELVSVAHISQIFKYMEDKK